MTARVAQMTTEITPEMQVGLMVRSSAAASNSVSRAFLLTSKSTLARASRTSTGGTTVMADLASGVTFPCWLRIVRTGSSVSFYYSPDGNTWTFASPALTTTSLTSTARVGMVMSSSPNIVFGRMGYARFDQVSLHTVPAAPTTPAAASGSVSGQIQISWGASAAASEYLVERASSAGGEFVEVARVPAGTLTYTDHDLSVGSTYYYRVGALNPAYQSGYTNVVSAAPYLAAGMEGWRYDMFGTEAAVGDAADDADPDQDGLSNLVEYALGRSPVNAHEAGYLLEPNVESIDGVSYLTYTFTQSTTTTGVTLLVQASDSLGGPWQDIDPSLAANRVSLQEDIPVVGVRTIVVKDVQPIGPSGRRFMRLKITKE